MSTFLATNHAKSQTGFIIFYVLLFLQICSLLNLQMLSTSTQQLKMAHTHWQAHQTFQEAKFILSQLSVTTTPCQIQRTHAFLLQTARPQWWHQYACQYHYQQTTYYYVIEHLGPNPCASVQNTLLVADYYRITLYWRPDKMPQARFLLQSTVVEPTSPKQTCNQTVHTLTAGQQTLRII